MIRPDLIPVPEMSTGALRENLSGALEAVRRSGRQMLITRHGQPVAGLVTAAEARTLWTVAHNDEGYVEWMAMRRLDKERALRMALMRDREAERQKEYERAVWGR